MQETLCHVLVNCKNRSGTAVEFYNKNKWHSYSWTQYFDQIEIIANGLLSMGVEPNDRVAIFANTRVEWALADYAALGIGAAVVPIYQSNIAEDVEYIITDSQAKVVICEDLLTYERFKSVKNNCPTVKHVVLMTQSSPETITWDEILKKGEEHKKNNTGLFEKLCKQRKLSDLATLVYTSGTTGRPKGVCLTHEQLMSEVSEVFKVLEVTPQDKALTFLPFAHILGRVEHWSHLYMGWNMVFAQSIDKISSNLQLIKPTFIVAVPRIFEKIYGSILSSSEVSPTKKKIFNWALDVGYKVSYSRLRKINIPISVALQYKMAKKMVFGKLAQKMGGRMRFAVCGGAPLSKDIASFFHAADLLILEGYGLTETTAAIAINNRFEYQFGTVGKAIGDVEFQIANDGEILVRSKKVMKGYYNNEEATREVLTEDGWFSTGDIGEITTEGYLRITDRKKDLIKTGGGKYVAPQKLENLLKLNRYVTNVVIHGDKKKYIVALLTLNQDEVKKYAQEHQISFKDYELLSAHPKVKDLARDIVAQANANLASYETIKNFAIIPRELTVESGEITPSLKVKRKFCEKKYAHLIDTLYGDTEHHAHA